MNDFKGITGWGIIVHPTLGDSSSDVYYAEVVPAESRWLPWPGRTSRWWYEVHSQKGDKRDRLLTTFAYRLGGSGGAFTFRKCVRRAQTAVDLISGEK